MSALFFPIRASPVKMGWFLLFLTFEREKNIIFELFLITLTQSLALRSKGNNSIIIFFHVRSKGYRLRKEAEYTETLCTKDILTTADFFDL